MACLIIIAYPVVVIGLAIAVGQVPEVGPLLSLLVLGLGAYIAIKVLRSPDGEGAGDGNPAATSRRAVPKRSQGHHPTPPSEDPAHPWAPARIPVEVVGETFRPDSFRAIFQGQHWTGDGGAEVKGVAALVRDPENPHDANAVAVWFWGQHVGYLPADMAARYSPWMERALGTRGLAAEARVWGRLAGGNVRARVTVHLPEPHGLGPINSLPDEPHVVLPPGSRIQVTKEEEHMDVLREIVVSGVNTPIAVTLHAIHEIRPRSAVESVEVRIYGERVGVLSPAQSTNLLPLVRYIEKRGLVVVSRASLSGSVLKADVVLNCIRADEADTDWLARLGPVAPRSIDGRAADEWTDEP